MYESADLPVGHLQLLGRRPGTPSRQAPVFFVVVVYFSDRAREGNPRRG